MQNTSTFHIRAPKSDAPDAKPDDRPAVGSPVGPVWDREGFARALCAWFAQSQRDLPWRHTNNARDPYRVLVSEVMLQQTTVAAVIPFYLRFLQRFPTLQVLAAAEIDDVLPLWAGLGYYSRARNLHAAARAVAENHGGVFPRDLEQVLALPGVGRYTAGAVTSIAFDAPSAIVDANVARVLSRLRAIEGDVKSPTVLAQLWEEAQACVEAATRAEQKPSAFNPAMMELGALVCRAREPDCPRCPVAQFCEARAQGRQHELPQIAPRRAPTPLSDACAFAVRIEAGEEQVLVRQRPHKPGLWWRGMWELPRTTIGKGEDARSALGRLLRDEMQLPAHVEEKPPLARLKHGITAYEVTLECFAIEVGAFEPRDGVRWAAWHELDALAIPSPMQKMLTLLRRERATGQRTLFEIG